MVGDTIRVQLPLLLLLPPRLHQSRKRPAELCQKDAENRCPEMPEQNNRCPDAPRGEELKELINLVEIILRLNIKLPRAGLVGELQHGGQVDGAAVEWNEPDGKDLTDADVEYHPILIVRYAADVEDDAGRHDLVPLEDLKDQPSAALEAAGAAEGVSEASIAGEVGLDC